MNSYIIAEQLFQFAMNSITTFFLFSLIAQGIITLFHIHNYRLRSFFYLLPFTRLLLEPIFWILPSFSIFNVSIFSCFHPFQRFLVGLLSEQTQSQIYALGMKTVTGYALMQISEPLLMIGLVSIGLFTLIRFLFLINDWKHGFAFLESAIMKGKYYPIKKIQNTPLRKKIQSQEVSIVVSNQITTPQATWNKKIVIPQVLMKNLSQNELESIFSHELEHIRWNDTHLRLILQATSIFYWWVPTNRLIDTIHLEQEKASDVATYEYNLDGFHIASALKKTISLKIQENTFCAAFTTSNGKTTPTLLQRTKAVLEWNKSIKQNKLSAYAGGTIGFAMLTLLGFAIC